MLTFVIVILCLYVFMRIMSRWVAPWLLKRYLLKMQERMNPQPEQPKTKKKGATVNISRKQKPTRSHTYNSAEEVDFEEVDEDD